MVTTRGRVGLAGLLTAVHRLATGRPLSIEEALEYFRSPKRLATVVEQSGLLHDPRRRLQLERLIATEEDHPPTEETNGI